MGEVMEEFLGDPALFTVDMRAVRPGRRGAEFKRVLAVGPKSKTANSGRGSRITFLGLFGGEGGGGGLSLDEETSQA